MDQKLKSKLFWFRRKFGFGVVFVVLLTIISGSFLFVSQAKAVKYEPKDVVIKVDTKVNGQNDNLIRLLKTETGKITVQLSLQQPPAGLVLTTDSINFQQGIYQVVRAIGSGLEISGTGNTCGTSKLTGFTGTATFVICDFPGGQKAASIPGNKFEVSKPVSVEFDLGPSQIASLKLGSASVTSPAKFTVYSYIQVDEVFGLSNPKVVIPSGGVDFYVQLFDDAAAKQAAVAGNIRTGVPAYGSNQGSITVGEAGSPVLGLINTIIGGLLGLIQEFIYLVFYWLIAPMIQSMLSIRTYTDTFAAVIYPGWEVVRNLSNIFFIVALIAIAMATLLRVESYKYKDLLIKLILAALLVNFSLVIAQAILGVADTIQNQFLPNNVEVIRSLAKDLMVSYRSDVYGNLTSAGGLDSKGYFSLTVKPLFNLALSLGSFLVFLAIGAFLVIRMVMLWVLLMLSPIPYVAGILPATEKFKGEWWSNFLKYAFFTPIMALFLNMAAVIANSQKDNSVLKQVLTDPSLIGADNFGSFVFSVGSNILLLVFLVVALKVADQAGVYGAKAITDIAQKGMFAPFAATAKIGKAAGEFGLEWASLKTKTQLNPMKWIEGFKESREINKKRRQDALLQMTDSRTTRGNPVAFWQRYWHPGTLIGQQRRADRKGQKILKEAKDLDDKAKALEKQIEELREELEGATPERQAEIQAEMKRLHGQMEGYLALARKKEYEGKQYILTPDYYTQEKTRHAVHEEKAKIHAETWEELVDLSGGALREGNVTRYLAIMQKLAETYNENELLTHTKYTRDISAEDSADGVAHSAGDTFDQTAEGLENFRKLIMVEKFGLSDQASMRAMADITDIAEQHNHWGIARAYGTKYGKMFFKPEEERDAEARAEKAKISEGKKNGDFNRLGDFDEITDTDYLTTGVRFDLIQKNGLLDLTQGHQNIRFRLGRGAFNNSKLKASSFGANIALMQAYANSIPDDQEIQARDERGQLAYQTDAAGKPILGPDGKKVPLMMKVKEDLLKTIEQLEAQGKEQWNENEEYNHQQALLRRANAGKLPARHVKALKDAGYLVETAPGRYDIGNRTIKNPDGSTKIVSWKLTEKFGKKSPAMAPPPPTSED